MDGTAGPSTSVGMTRCEFVADLGICHWEGPVEIRYPTPHKERLESGDQDLSPARVCEKCGLEVKIVLPE